MWKRCNNCGVEKPLTAFYRYARSRDGHMAECSDCRKVRATKYKQSRAYFSARRLGISVEQWQAIFDSQNGCCAVCGDEHPKLYLDHDHVTGKVRAFLCPKCNLILGQAADDPDRLRALAEYVERHRALARVEEPEVEEAVA